MSRMPQALAPRELGAELARCMREATFSQTAQFFETIAAQHAIPPKMASAFGDYAAFHGQTEHCERAYSLAMGAAPSPQTLMSRGISRLRVGLWREGWADMEHRLDALRLTPFTQLRGKLSGRSVERWRTGEPLPDDLLVFPEQGLGDTLQFARFLPQLVRRGVRVTVVGARHLEPAIASLSPAPRFHPRDEPLLVERADRWCCLMSLPALLGLEDEAELGEPPYLFQHLARPISSTEKSAPLKVGLSWQGNPDHPRDKHRSAPLTVFEPFLIAPEVQPVSLQIGPGATQIAKTPGAERMATPLSDSASLADTAKVIAGLDLVVSVDTAVAHLAGAMGCPTALLLAAAGVDWRWRRGSASTVWYSSMTIFHQTQAGLWGDPVNRALSHARAAPGRWRSLDAISEK